MKMTKYGLLGALCCLAFIGRIRATIYDVFPALAHCKDIPVEVFMDGPDREHALSMSQQILLGHPAHKSLASGLVKTFRRDSTRIWCEWIEGANLSTDGQRMLLFSGYGASSCSLINDRLTKSVRFPEIVDLAKGGSNGKYLVTEKKGNVSLWDVEKGLLIKEFKHSGMVFFTRFTSDGSHLLAAYNNGIARFWHVETGRVIGEINYSDNIHLAQAPDRQCVVILSTIPWTNRVCVGDIETGKKIKEFVHSRPICSISMSQDNKYLMTTGNADGIAYSFIWNIAEGRLLHEFCSGSSRYPHEIHVSSDGTYALTISGTIMRQWDILTGRQIREFNFAGISEAFHKVSPDGKIVMTRRSDSVCLWSVETGQPFKQSILCSSDGIVDFSSDSKYVVLTDHNVVRLVALELDRDFAAGRLDQKQTLFLLLLHNYFLSTEKVFPDELSNGLKLSKVAERMPEVSFDELQEILGSFSPAVRYKIIAHYHINDYCVPVDLPELEDAPINDQGVPEYFPELKDIPKRHHSLRKFTVAAGVTIGVVAGGIALWRWLKCR